MLSFLLYQECVNLPPGVSLLSLLCSEDTGKVLALVPLPVLHSPGWPLGSSSVEPGGARPSPLNLPSPDKEASSFLFLGLSCAVWVRRVLYSSLFLSYGSPISGVLLMEDSDGEYLAARQADYQCCLISSL